MSSEQTSVRPGLKKVRRSLRTALRYFGIPEMYHLNEDPLSVCSVRESLFRRMRAAEITDSIYVHLRNPLAD